MSTAQGIKLSKKLFMSLQPGQYIMDNYIPHRYEKIEQDLNSQWEKWRCINGRIVTIYDSEAECLREWWAHTSAASLKSQGKALYHGKMDKKIFMESPRGHFMLFTQAPLEYIEFQEDREEQWLKYKNKQGLSVLVFKNRNDCVMAKNDILEMVSNKP